MKNPTLNDPILLTLITLRTPNDPISNNNPNIPDNPNSPGNPKITLHNPNEPSKTNYPDNVMTLILLIHKTLQTSKKEDNERGEEEDEGEEEEEEEQTFFKLRNNIKTHLKAPPLTHDKSAVTARPGKVQVTLLTY